MAAPATVIPTPGDPDSHLLFFLNGYKQQLAMEVRPVVNTTQYTAFQDNGVPKGVIVNPSSLSAVLCKNVVSLHESLIDAHLNLGAYILQPTVYGITKLGGIRIGEVGSSGIKTVSICVRN
jgi:hypothetical protein